MNKKEELLHAQVKNRFVDFLKAASLPYWEPELTVCPRCGEHIGITLGCLWSCEHCNIHGDVVDYVMELEHMADKLSAIKRICRALQIKITSLDVIRADELMDTQFETGNILIDKPMGQGVYLIAGSPKIGKSWLMLWLAHRVSMGEDVWNFKTNKCDVLYISLEDPRHRVQDRLARVTRGETGNVWIATESELMSKGFEEQLIGFLCENPAVKSANALTRLLNPNKAILWTEFGILYECERTGKERKLHLTCVRDDGNDDSDDRNTVGDDTVITVTE